MQSSSFISTRFCRISSFDAANQRHVWAIVFVWKQGEAGKLCQRGNRCITGFEKCPLMEWLVCIWICRNYPWAHKEQRLQLFLAIFRTSGPIWIGKKEVSPSVYTQSGLAGAEHSSPQRGYLWWRKPYPLILPANFFKSTSPFVTLFTSISVTENAFWPQCFFFFKKFIQVCFLEKYQKLIFTKRKGGKKLSRKVVKGINNSKRVCAVRKSDLELRPARKLIIYIGSIVTGQGSLRPLKASGTQKGSNKS